MFRSSSPWLLLTLVLLLPGAAPANGEVDVAAIQRLLDADEGWVVHKLDAKGGVDVYRKPIDGMPVPGFKGVKIVEVDSDHLFEAINDFDHQVGLSEDIPLTRSQVLKRSGQTLEVFQYLDVPGWTLAKDRYWFVRATLHHRIGGEAGHHKQIWEQLDPSTYPVQVAAAQAIDEDAVMVEINYGSWEVIPLGGGKTKLIYRVLSSPGGKLPRAAQSIATGRTLPDNLLQFEAEGRRREHISK